MNSIFIVAIPGKLNESIDHLTEAIVLNPKSALLYASRGDFSNRFLARINILFVVFYI